MPDIHIMLRKRKSKPIYKQDEIRYVKKFIWKPTFIGGYFVWFHTVTIKQKFGIIEFFTGWKNVCLWDVKNNKEL